jgi:Tfp pilus assembly protein FimT
MKLPHLIAILGVIALPVMAQTSETPRADQREANQQARIQQGVASGELNAHEAARLERGQTRVDAIENNAKADGTVTKKERAHLHRAQDHQSKRIHRQKHDAQKAPVVPAS